MPTYSDDFNRPDGPLGNGWTVTSGQFTILGNAAAANGSSQAQWDQGASAGRQLATIVCHNVQAGYSGLGVGVKNAVGSAQGYWAHSYNPGSGHVIYLWRGQPGFGSLLTSYTIGGAVPDDYTISIEYDSGTIRVWYGASLIITHSDSTYAANERCGIHGLSEGARINAFSVESGPAALLEITPDPVWVGGGDVWMLATGSGVEWTIGDPGSSEISTDHGTIVTQLTTSSTTIEFLYRPANYLGAITFTESEFGLSDTINTTLEPPVPGLGAKCKLTDDGALMVNTTALLQADNRILTEKLIVHYAPVRTIPTILDDIYMYMRGLYGGDPPGDPDQALLMFLWQTLNGGQDPPVGAWDVTDNMPIKQDTWRTKLDVEAIRGIADRTLEDVITLVGGSPLVYSNADIMNAITNIGAGSNQDVLDALAAYFGANPPTIQQLGQMVSDISTVAGYTLADVLDAIAAIQPGDVDLTPVLNKLTLIQPNSDVTLTTIMDQLTGMQNTLANTYNNVVAIRTGLDYTLADVIDRINAIGASLTNAVGAHPPVWPGEAYVTFGATGDLVDDLYIEGPLHGLLLSITAQPVRTQKFMFGNVASWARVGQIIFETDSGEYERSQTFGLDRQVLVPLTMARANGALVRLNEGWEGTYQPWTINESA